MSRKAEVMVINDGPEQIDAGQQARLEQFTAIVQSNEFTQALDSIAEQAGIAISEAAADALRDIIPPNVTEGVSSQLVMELSTAIATQNLAVLLAFSAHRSPQPYKSREQRLQAIIQNLEEISKNFLEDALNPNGPENQTIQ